MKWIKQTKLETLNTITHNEIISIAWAHTYFIWNILMDSDLYCVAFSCSDEINGSLISCTVVVIFESIFPSPSHYEI